LRNREFRRKFLIALSAMIRLLWGVSQVLICEIEHEPQNASLIKALRDAQRDMLNAARDLGIDVRPFEAYERKDTRDPCQQTQC
jgi:hypothetical protein